MLSEAYVIILYRFQNVSTNFDAIKKMILTRKTKKVSRKNLKMRKWKLYLIKTRVNARRTCRTIKCWSINDFQTFEGHIRMIQKQGNWVLYELKPTKGAKWPVNCFKDTEKKFFASYRDGWWKMNTIIRNARNHSASEPSTSTAKPNIYGVKLCIWWDQLGIIYSVLWAAPTQQNHHWGTLPTIDAIEPSKIGQIMRRNMTKWFSSDNARPHVAKLVKETLETFNWDTIILAIFFRYCSFRLSISITHSLSEQRFHSYGR